MPAPDHPTSWRRLLGQAERVLADAGTHCPAVDARWIVERASGHDGAELALHLDEAAPARAVIWVDQMVGRRSAGEPLQYVVGRWGFRALDLLVDRRVLIPRPETEVVVELALAETRRLGGLGRPLVAVDLGTGSGAIAISLATELVEAQVWGVDSSAEALQVARANLAGAGHSATRVTLVEGSWFEPLPRVLRGGVDLVVANPPYVAEGDELPAEVAEWEPRHALVAGPDGTEQLATIVAEAPAWLARPGSLVAELAPDQASAVSALAVAAGFTDVSVHPDLAGRQRVLIARLG